MLIDGVWISPPMVDELSRRLGVHRTTVRRWMEQAKFPPAVLQLLLLLENGQLGDIHDAWQDWSLEPRTGRLRTPVGTSIAPGEILSIPYRLHLVTAQQRRIAELEAELEQLKSAVDPVRFFDGAPMRECCLEAIGK